VRNPWVGLRPFQASEQDLFFGREREARILSTLVATLPILVVYAPSGTGKSSLINAGLGPDMAQDPHQVAVFVGPQGDAVSEARAALACDAWEAPERPDVDLAALLEDHWAATGRRAAVIIDQFEERLNKAPLSEEIFTAAAKLVHGGTDAGCVVLSIREDYLGGLEPLMRRVPSLMDGSYRVPALSRTALESAVYGPLGKVGGAVEADKALVKRALDDLERGSTLRQEPGEQRFEPGYFQIVWSTLWDRSNPDAGSNLTLTDYERLGGAERILRNFTSDILDDLEPAQTQLFWAMTRYLVLPTGAKLSMTVEDVARLLRREDFLSYYSRYASSVNPWLSTLSSERLTPLIRQVFEHLTSSEAPIFQRVVRSDREEFELLHDLLGRILLDWRSEYEQVIVARTNELFAGLEPEARRQAEAMMVATDQSSLAERAQRLIGDVAQSAKAYHTRLRRAADSETRLALVAEADQLMTRRMVVSLITQPMEFTDYYEASQELEEACAAIGPVMIPIALDDKSETVRRQFQARMPLWSNTSVRLGPWISATGANRALLFVMAIGSGVVATGLAGVLFHGATDSLGIQYAALTLAHVALFAAVIYGVLLGAEGGGRWEGARNVLAPAIAAGRGRPALFVATLPFTWPLPVIWAVAAGVAAAAGFDAAGWAATAGFNVGVVFGGIGAAVGTTVAVDSV
jgi:hypothetical protein